MSRNDLKTKGLNFLTEKDITPDDYGAYVLNYTTPCGIEKDNKHGIGGWRIFYADEKNIYLIADDYIYKTYAPKGIKGSEIHVNANYRLSMDSVIDDYEGTSDIQDRLKVLNKKYFDKGYTSSNENMKAVAYMLDTEIWDEKFKNAKFAEYTIGGPSIELFANSYNKKYTDKKISIVSTSNGYRIMLNSKKMLVFRLYTSKDNVYVITSKKAYGMWLCSPSAYDSNYIFDISCDGHVKRTCDMDSRPSFRPVVCLKSDIQLMKVGNGFEIVE